MSLETQMAELSSQVADLATVVDKLSNKVDWCINQITEHMGYDQRLLAQIEIIANGAHHARGAAERCALACESLERMVKHDTLPARSSEVTPPKGISTSSLPPPSSHK